MKKISIYILCFIGLISLETCKKPDLSNENTINVSIVFDETLSASGQKLYVDGVDIELYWTSGDEMKLVNATNNLTLTYSGVNERIARFGYAGSSIPAGSYIGFHPTTATVTAYNNITYSVPSTYSISPTAPDAYMTNDLLMYTPSKYTHGGSNMAYFKPAMTILEIPLQMDSGTHSITSVTLRSIGASNAFIKKGKLPDVINNGTVLTVQDSGNTIIYNFTGQGLSIGTTPQTIKFLVWSNPNTSGLTAYTIGIDTCTAAVKTLTKTTPFLNSKYYKFPAITICNASVNPPPAPEVGDSYGGGYVFHIFTSGQTGYVAGQTHGLIVATSNLSSTFTWGCLGTIVGNDTFIGDGQANTARMITAGCGGAAYACDTFTGGGYTDWFLPSSAELCKIHYNITYGKTTSITGGQYWSSSEGFGWWEAGKDNGAYASLSQWGGAGVPYSISKTNSIYVIPVRKF